MSDLKNWITQNKDLYELSPVYEAIKNPKILEVGVTAYIQLNISDNHPINANRDLLGGFQIRVKIIDIENTGFLWGEAVNKIERLKQEGYYDYNIEFDAPIRFHYTHIHMLFGNLEWELKHKSVDCSLKIIEGEKVGYFIDRFYNEPLQIEKAFYAVSEIELPKKDCLSQVISLKQLVEIDDTIIPYLNQRADYGALKDSKNTFKTLTKQYIRYFDKEIYPTRNGW